VGQSEFDRDTAVVRTGEETFTASLSKDWWVFAGANGGYLASVLLRALTERVGEPERAARSLTVHYVRPPAEGPVEIEMEVVRSGRSLATLTARLTQGGEVAALATAAFSKPRPSLEFHDASMPPVPGPDDTAPSSWPEPLLPPVARRFEYRPVSSEAMFAGEPRAEVGAWLRLREPRPVDAVLLATVADALAPAVFPKADRPVTATTVDLTVHFRAPAQAEPYDGWCLATFRSTVAVDGFVEEDGEVWTPSGRLVAHSRQLALVVPLS
jgi:acyl-CoA thioesterase